MRRAVVPVLLVVVVLLAAVVVYRIERPLPAAHVSLSIPGKLVVAPGTPPPIPLPPQGALEIDSEADGTLAAVAADKPLPIGSVAKTMTALVTLEARPITSGDGPEYIITAHDVALYRAALAAGGSTVSVTAGEQFSERQLLLALLLPSANNLAESLALWVSGTRDAFLTRLNAEAVRLGMTHTHFDDPAGFSDATVSSASDLVKLGRAVLADPTLASIVATRSAVLPTGETVQNLDRNLAQPGWLGIKTGSTNAAGGCLLFAAERTPQAGGPPVRVIGALLGQPSLDAVLTSSLAIGQAALAGYVDVDLARLDTGISGTVSTEWGQQAGVTITGDERSVVVARVGSTVDLSGFTSGCSDSCTFSPQAPGDRLGRVDAFRRGTSVAVYSVRSAGTLTSPDVWWRLTH